MPITITSEVPLPTKIVPDYTPGVSVVITAPPPRPASSITMKTQISMSDSEYSENYTFNPNSSDEATAANAKYPLAWNFYFNNGTTYTSLPYTPARAKDLQKAINFYLYNRTDREDVSVEFNSERELVDKGDEIFQAPTPALIYGTGVVASTEILLSDLYYGSDQTQGNTGKTRLPIPSSELNISVAKVSKLGGLSPTLSGAYAGQKPLIR